MCSPASLLTNKSEETGWERMNVLIWRLRTGLYMWWRRSWKFARLKFNWIQARASIIYTRVLDSLTPSISRDQCTLGRNEGRLARDRVTLLDSKSWRSISAVKRENTRSRRMSMSRRRWSARGATSRRWYSTRRRKPIWIEAKPEGISLRTWRRKVMTISVVIIR